MKWIISSIASIILILTAIMLPAAGFGQSEKAVIKKYLTDLPKVTDENREAVYRMTAVYKNMDLYGNFTGKTKVTGDYTMGLPGDSAIWNNVSISVSNGQNDPFPAGTIQKYMEGFKYIPSPNMVTEKEAFKNFPSSPENIFARNLIWDMYSFDIFSWLYYDSLKLNETYITPDSGSQFNMAEIGTYFHNNIMLRWTGITQMNNKICSVIEFAAIDNKLELDFDRIKSKGTEQYWGTIILSVETKLIENCVMYGGTIQEIEVEGMKDKFLIKTIRELEVERIR